jgi:small-conductance mechanosensitive channel
VIDLGVTWDIPAPKLERAVALIEAIYRGHPKTANLLVSVNKFDSCAINIRIVHWWDSTSLPEYLLGFQKLNLELKRRLEAEGISFGSPSQNVYLRQEPPAS